MRVIGGEFRSRVLKSLPGMDTRPTPDRLRETLFDILATRIEGCIFVDAYAGTGAVGIEAISRSARRAIFLERSRPAVNLIRDNLRALKIGEDRAVVAAGKVSTTLARFHADIVFLDPPFTDEREYEAAFAVLGEKAPALVIAQHSSHFALGATQGQLERYRVLKQGDNTLSFFAPKVS